MRADNRSDTSLQEQYAPQNACFGCGPANSKGLRIRSFAEGDQVVADWTPEPHHQAFEGVMNGGIIGALLDCHSNWTALYHLMKRNELTEAPCTVTADFHVRLLAPTPMEQVHLSARVVESSERKAVVEAELTGDGKVTATCKGTFVAVPKDHPAHQRW